ncbi:Dihydrofolate reductase [Pseudonocardia sp. Ae406_Ps2]|uniref:dihydrofolate reductase family protein n=1 Tax=unclassified Pseudonocardia TaxID=2619320 RepID=UPI00094B2FDA|nr:MULTISPECIES: dihydrofolate reductase family protein [unclassified Pseudonocardia]OLM01005.1 Dihydrofolate reductase [Pseudonocardia sp. Ae406_Ps2]OLM07200.1 Dihydrofolate reductase [Pseudonocardia sp. Ae331_Ps2]OLM14394.1 Dihydrofolate reductase [Pseudonocardia sp. Ae505_Ps2]OLM22583.1 Dihydrofolate reductase [Pseudonocardia sp. Ae706_Ps2]OLM31558.1 Dihydrofolate reductase [Pseudonocardia sp. Ae717_Ps2]
MGTIDVHEFISLDGVVSDPSWTAEYGFPDAMGEAIGRLTDAAILLGRTTYEMFHPAWSARGHDVESGGAFFNGAPKHVVTSTLADPLEWENARVLGPYDPVRIQQLKDATGGGIYVSGSVTLVRALLADGLVDTLNLFVYPVSLGAGLRLFAEGVRAPLRLRESEAYENGVVRLTYGPPAA